MQIICNISDIYVSFGQLIATKDTSLFKTNSNKNITLEGNKIIRSNFYSKFDTSKMSNGLN